jgi:hypothetical protein
MQSVRIVSMKGQRIAAFGLMALAASLPAAADSTRNEQQETYTWSAELIELDRPEGTITVESRLVSNAEIDLGELEKGSRVTLTWSGINTAAGVRRIVDGPAAEDDLLTLPIELVSADGDQRYVRFKVAVPTDDLAKIESLQPGAWITATSPRRATHFEEAVADLRPYNDVG